MLIDPFTVVAQAVNFLILIWLLRRVLYGPVTRAMDERDARIRRDIEDARRLQREAAATRDELERQVAAFAAERDARLADAREEVETWRQTRMDAARVEMNAIRERWQQALVRERQTAIADLRRRVVHEVLSLVRMALHDLADADLEERVIARFASRLRELSPEDRTRLRAAASADAGRVHLRAWAGLTDADRARLRDAVADAIDAQLTVEFDATAEPGSGVELRAGDLKISWSLDDYLGSLEDRLSAAFGDAPDIDHEHA